MKSDPVTSIASSIFRCVGIETPSDPSAWNKAILWPTVEIT